MNAMKKGNNGETRGAAAFLAAWLVNVAALAIAESVLPGVEIRSFGVLLFASLALVAASLVIEPLLYVLTMPINFATFGVFSAVISGIVVMLTAFFVTGFELKGILWGLPQAVGTALIISVCRVILRAALRKISVGQ